MFFLIALLVVALGAGANYLAYGAIRAFGNPASVSSQKQNIVNKGGFKFMDNNPWLRYALYSFLGILLLMVFVGLLAPNQQGMYGQGQMQMMPGMNGGNMQMPYGNASFTGGMMVPVILVPVNMQMHNAMGQMPMGMQGGQMPMNTMQGNMGQMPMGMQSGMGQMPMGMQGGNMGNMQGGGMGMMNMSGSGMSGGSSSSGGGMGMM